MSIEVTAGPDPYEAAIKLFQEVSPRTLILAGGSTPRPLYERLALVDHRWSETDVFFSDERCVPATDADSNYRMAFEALLSKVPARVHAMTGEACDADAAESDLRAFFGPQPVHFDLAFLGLGEEGHTASLFPGDPALEVEDRLVVRVQRPDHARLSLTLAALNATGVAVFLVTGSSKASAVRALLSGEDIPAGRVKAGRVVLIADDAAMSGVSGAGAA